MLGRDVLLLSPPPLLPPLPLLLPPLPPLLPALPALPPLLPPPVVTVITGTRLKTCSGRTTNHL